jgi:hypothetical protein
MIRTANPCWGFDDVFRNDPESVSRIHRLLTNAVASLLRTALDHSDAARIQWQRAIQKYCERWAQGDLDGVVPVLTELLAWLRAEGIDPARNADVIALQNDPCVVRIRSRIPAFDYEPNFLDVFRRLAAAIGR